MMTKLLDHDSFIGGVFYKAGSPVPPKQSVPAQVAPTDELTADMTVDELIDFFRNGHGPKGAAAIVDRLDVAGLDIADLKSKLDARNSSDTDAAQLIADANKERDEALAEVARLETERSGAATERDAAMQAIEDLTKERDDLKDQLADAVAAASAAAKPATKAK
ncbi:hypothetical protein K3M67_04795 [Sphingobium sp. V4]|uniref:hypothetical protein n=1 Tax=Sphingobium sp. V4 TaxID=3038927 RepID=UPI002558165D|nr:hypothetical protein [Sphingobium sp. V4]WIW89297.1 hypothetical protein K3M67_04795 [Sphingobium sp. V4]